MGAYRFLITRREIPVCITYKYCFNTTSSPIFLAGPSDKRCVWAQVCTVKCCWHSRT